MAVEIEALELSISHESKGATNSIGKLVSALTHLRQAASGGAGLNQVVSQLKHLHQALSASSATGAALALSATQKSAASAAVAVQQASRQVTELSSEYSSVQSSAASAASAMGGATAETKNAASATGKVASTAKSASQATKELARETKNAGSAAKNSSGFFSRFARSLGRVMFYRAIRTALRIVVQALKEGITNLYYYSQAVNNTDTAQAANTMDAYASAILRVKNSIGAALMPIIQAALPLIQTLTNAIVTALNFFNKFVSALTGHSTYTYAAADATTSFASSLGGAAGAAKELRKQLNIMGFDELNILEETDSGGGGGGGGGGSSTPPYSEMFETAPIEPEFLKKMEEWLNPIKTAIDNIKSTWDKFMKTPLGQALKKAVQWLQANIPVELFNGIANVFDIIASSIEVINTLFDPNKTFSEKFGDILGLGGNIFEKIGENNSTPGRLVLGFFNQALGSLFGKEGGLLPDEWIEGIAMVTAPGGTGLIGILGKLLIAIVKVYSVLAKALGLEKETKQPKTANSSIIYRMNEGTQKNAQQEVEDFVDGFLAPGTFAPKNGASKKINEAIGDWLKGLSGTIKNKKESNPWASAINNWIDKNIRGIFGGSRNQKTNPFKGKTLFDKSALKKDTAWFKNNVTDKTKTNFNNMEESVKKGFRTSYGDAKTTWRGSGAWFKNNVTDPTGKNFTSLTKGIKTVMVGARDDTNGAWSGSGAWFKENATDPIKAKFNDLKTNIGTDMGKAWTDTSTAWTDRGTWFSDNAKKPIENVFTNLKTGIKKSANESWSGMKSAFYKPINKDNWFGENVRKPITKVFNNTKDKITSAFSGAWSNVKKTFDSKTTTKYFNDNLVQPFNKELENISNKTTTVTVNIKTPNLKWELKEVEGDFLRQKLGALNIGTSLPQLKVSWYAGGGYGIPNGQLFMANEAGPELVGQMNGRNTVANQGQIVEGIRQGVYDAVVSAFANNGGQSNHITVKVGDGTLADVVTRALNNQTRRLGYSQLEGI